MTTSHPAEQMKLIPAEQVREARRMLGLSQSGLAAALRMREQDAGRTVGRWEAGEQDVPDIALLALDGLVRDHIRPAGEDLEKRDASLQEAFDRIATDFAARAQAAGYDDAEIVAAAVAIALNVLVGRSGPEGAAAYLRELADAVLAGQRG